MDSTSIYYKNMVDAMTYDGNMLFGHDRRNYIPLPEIPHEHWGQWSDNVSKRLYADEINVPNDYMIVDTNLFGPIINEGTKVIKINSQQVAIPMKEFFRLKDMDLYQQWEIIRYNCILPKGVFSGGSLERALQNAYDHDVEGQLKGMFYDMKRDDPAEFARRKELLPNQIRRAYDEMEACYDKINKLRFEINGGWSDLLEELYYDYTSERDIRKWTLEQYCEIAAKRNTKFASLLEEIQTIHSSAWYASVICDEYARLYEVVTDLEKQEGFRDYLYTFDDELIPLTCNDEDKLVAKSIPIHEPTINKESVQEIPPIPQSVISITDNSKRLITEKAFYAPTPTAEELHEKKCEQTFGERVRNWILKIMDKMDPE